MVAYCICNEGYFGKTCSKNDAMYEETVAAYDSALSNIENLIGTGSLGASDAMSALEMLESAFLISDDVMFEADDLIL